MAAFGQEEQVILTAKRRWRAEILSMTLWLICWSIAVVVFVVVMIAIWRSSGHGAWKAFLSFLWVSFAYGAVEASQSVKSDSVEDDWTMLVLTTDRVVAKAGRIGRKMREFRLVNVTDVSASQPLLRRVLGLGDLTIRVGSGESIRVLALSQPFEVEKVVNDQIERCLKGDRPNRDATASPKLSTEEKLRQLKKLHDDGLITEEEYEQRKKQFLDEM